MGCALVLLPLSMVIATMYYPCLSLRYDDDAVVHCFNPSLCYPDGDHQRQNRDHLLVLVGEVGVTLELPIVPYWCWKSCWINPQQSF